MVAMTACGAAVATTVTDRDVRAVPFIQDGRLAFTVYNQNDQVAIAVGTFVPTTAKQGACPAVFAQAGGTVAPRSQITLQTAVPIAQLLDCLEPGWRDRFSPADVIKVADTPDAFPALHGNGSARLLATPFGYTFTFSGTGWKTQSVTSGFVYFQKRDR
jgi:hypothetical protein